MSSRLLLCILLLSGGEVRAQVSEPVLRNRLTNLTARRAVLESLVARRDSLAPLGQELVPVGHPPLTFRVPVWAAAKSAPMVDSVLADWESRIGPIFMRAPAEIIMIPFSEDTAGHMQDEINRVIDAQPLVILFNASRASATRVRREVGPELMRWLGEELPASRPGIARREAILALSRDSTAVGIRCLEGIATACLEALRREGLSAHQVRRAFADWALGEAGPDGWEQLARDPRGDPETRIVALVGGDPASATGRWIAAVRDPARAGPTNFAGFHLLAFAWAAGLILLFLWRLSWHRA